MRYGAGLNTSKAITEVVEEARKLADEGFSCLSSSHIFGYDAIALLEVVGLQVPDVELMTAVVPIYTRHPIAMAQQALTVQAATGGRFALGIGLSHQVLVEAVYGLSFDQPLRAMREYLAILMPLLHHENVRFRGETVSASAGPLEIDVPAPPQVIVAALGTAMLELAGEVADGTATWMTGPKTLAEHIVPTIRSAAERAGRPSPRVCAALPVCVTDEVEAARRRADEVFSLYGSLPSYRAMLDREGAAGPGDAAIVGSEAAVRAVLEEIEAAGVTDFSAAPIGSREEIDRTTALFRELTSAG
ncbi:MAG: TIGR03564 family F420-dependent LLM class oxidoreductase [Acidimicrobiales bacterium]|jgi:F420-dependent oxidoreductase-like protein